MTTVSSAHRRPRRFFWFNPLPTSFLFFFFNDTATTEIYTLSLHDALPISARRNLETRRRSDSLGDGDRGGRRTQERSEEHTSELQSRLHLVCRLLLEKKKKSKATKACIVALTATT